MPNITATPGLDAETIKQLLHGIDTTSRGQFWELDASDPWFRPHTDTMTWPASELRPSVVDAIRTELEKVQPLRRKPSTLATIYDLDGREIPMCERGEDWWETQIKVRHRGPTIEEINRHPNGAIRLGNDYIYVNRGVYVPVSEDTIDGEVVFAFKTRALLLGEEDDRVARARATFIAAHPQIETFKPDWAETYDVEEFEGFEDGCATVHYRGDFGSCVRFAMTAYVDHESIWWAGSNDYWIDGVQGDLSPEDARSAAEALVRIAHIIEVRDLIDSGARFWEYRWDGIDTPDTNPTWRIGNRTSHDDNYTDMFILPDTDEHRAVGSKTVDQDFTIEVLARVRVASTFTQTEDGRPRLYVRLVEVND